MGKKDVMTLAQAVAAAKPTKVVNAAGEYPKTPAGYNRKANQCIQDMINHTDPVVRMAILGSKHAPSTKLRESLKVEEDPQVLRAILMNPQLTVKAIDAFITDPRCEQFAKDKELEAHLVARVKSSTSE